MSLPRANYQKMRAEIYKVIGFGLWTPFGSVMLNLFITQPSNVDIKFFVYLLAASILLPLGGRFLDIAVTIIYDTDEERSDAS